MCLLDTFEFYFKFQNTNPERGRKRQLLNGPMSLKVKFQNTNPERGRKQCKEEVRKESKAPLFQNTNPERGRKLGTYDEGEWVPVFQNTNPERGRKRPAPRDPHPPSWISEHEPRKGTETLK